MEHILLNESICGKYGTPVAPLLVLSPDTVLHAPTSLSGGVLLRTAEQRTLKLESGLIKTVPRGRRKEGQKFLQNCFKSSEYSVNKYILRNYHMPKTGVRRPKVKTKTHAVIKCNEGNR